MIPEIEYTFSFRFDQRGHFTQGGRLKRIHRSPLCPYGRNCHPVWHYDRFRHVERTAQRDAA